MKRKDLILVIVAAVAMVIAVLAYLLVNESKPATVKEPETTVTPTARPTEKPTQRPTEAPTPETIPDAAPEVTEEEPTYQGYLPDEPTEDWSQIEKPEWLGEDFEIFDGTLSTEVPEKLDIGDMGYPTIKGVSETGNNFSSSKVIDYAIEYLMSEYGYTTPTIWNDFYDSYLELQTVTVTFDDKACYVLLEETDGTVHISENDYMEFMRSQGYE